MANSTSVSRLFQKSWSLEPRTVLSQVKQQIKNRHDGSYQRLEIELNNLFYPKPNENVVFAKRLQELKEQAIQKSLHGLSRDIAEDISNILKIYGVDNKHFLGAKTVKDRRKISSAVFMGRKKQIEEFVVQIGKRYSSESKLSWILTQADQLLKDMNQYINSLDMVQLPFYLDTSSNIDLFNKIDQIYNLIMDYSTISDLTGILEERAQYAAAIIIEKGITNVTDKETIKILNTTFNNLSKNQMPGSTTVSRKNIQEETNKNLDQKKWTYKIGGETISLKTELRDTYGKMDIEYKTSYQPGSSFRSSNKSWTDFSTIHNFNEVNLLGGIIRGGQSIEDALSYGLVMRYYGSRSKLYGEYSANTIKLHYYAKACILVDTLIGISQREGFTNVLIINNTSKKHIYVVDIYNVVSRIERNLYLLNNVYSKDFGDFDKVVEAGMIASLNGAKMSTTFTKGANLGAIQSAMRSIKLRAFVFNENQSLNLLDLD